MICSLELHEASTFSVNISGLVPYFLVLFFFIFNIMYYYPYLHLQRLLEIFYNFSPNYIILEINLKEYEILAWNFILFVVISPHPTPNRETTDCNALFTAFQTT